MPGRVGASRRDREAALEDENQKVRQAAARGMAGDEFDTRYEMGYGGAARGGGMWADF